MVQCVTITLKTVRLKVGVKIPLNALEKLEIRWNFTVDKKRREKVAHVASRTLWLKAAYLVPTHLATQLACMLFRSTEPICDAHDIQTRHTPVITSFASTNTSQ